MSDAEDTEVFPTTPEVETATVPSDDVTPPQDVSINELPNEVTTPSAEQVKSLSNTPSKNKANEITLSNSKDDGKGPNENKEQTEESSKAKEKKLQSAPPPRSRCRARSRDTRQCKKHFREMIGKHEIRNDELEQREADLRQRMEMLECSMPAVMVWNIWRMAQGAPVSHLREIVEKQFLEPAGGFPTCPSTPSQHWDCRVREVEAERKQAQQRAEEARQVFAVKEDALNLQRQQIEKARELQEERKMQVAKLEGEVKRLQDALKKAQGDENSCETGECGEIQCRQMWLQGVSSVNSIHSTDLECLARLQDLAEAELCMKRQIADLERRECAYMRTLQQADEMWAKMEDDNASNIGDLQEQLDAKIAANQQLADRIVELEDEIEKLRAQLTKAMGALDEYAGKTFADVGLGDVNISTEEKIEQTEDRVKDIEVSGEDKAEDIEVPKEIKDTEITAESGREEIKSFNGDLGESEKIEKLSEDKTMENTPGDESIQTQPKLANTADKSSIPEEVEGGVKDSVVLNEKSDYQHMPDVTEISTIEESVQVKAELKDAETQSIPKKPGSAKAIATEEQSPIKTATITEAVGGEGMAAVAEIGLEVSVRHLAEQQQGITTLGQALKAEAEHVDELGAAADSSRSLKDKGSSAHLLTAATEGKDTGVSVAKRTEENSSDQNKASQVTPEATSRVATPGIAVKLADEIAHEITPQPASKPVAKVSTETAPRPDAETARIASPGPTPDVPSEPAIKAGPVTTPEIPIETAPIKFPVSVTETTPESALKPSTESAIDAIPISTPEPAVKAGDAPTLEPTAQIIEPTEIKQAPNTLAVPIQTLLSWHNITACIHKQVLICPQCSSTGGEIGQMLNEIRACLEKHAPDLAKIECAKDTESVEKSVPIRNKKGPCICKPETCPLDGTPAAVRPQASVQIQTVIDDQTQTSMPIKIATKDIKSPKFSKGATRSKEDVKLTSIDEGTEPDSRIRRGKSIPEAKDESTVTVGDIASQTETIRKAPSLSKDDEKTCVCPTGVCPKKNVKPPCGECKPGRICTSSKKAHSKEYKSTADAILAPAIKVVPSNESRSSTLTNNAKTDNMASKSSTFACCMCGKPVTPVGSKKSTSIAMPTKSPIKSKVMLMSEGSDDDFLCCACIAKGSKSTKPKNSSPGKTFEKSMEAVHLSRRVKPASENIEMSCSREICCPCDNEEIHVLAKTLTTDIEPPKFKTRPETKDVCCLAKISRDKALKTEARRHKDKDSIKATTPSVSQSGSDKVFSNSSTYKAPKINDSSDSNVCCSSLEQVIGMTKKKGKGNKCACDGQEGKGNKEGCVCGEDSQSIKPKQKKHSESSLSCVCPPKLFDKF